MRRTDPRKRAAFTLVELLVVVAIIALLTALLLPSLNRARFVTRLSVCGGNLRQIGVGAFSYATANKGYYPTLGYNPVYTPDDTKVGRRLAFSGESTPTGVWGAYFGADDKKCDWQLPAFQCPQGKTEAWWFTKKRSASGSRGTSHSGWRGFYNLYFDLYGGIDGGANSWDGKMRKQGDTFTTRWSKRKFKLIASDVCKAMRLLHATDKDTGWMTNHIWQGNRNWSWDDPGAAHFSYGPLYYNSTTGRASTNWLFDDGAVQRKNETNIDDSVDWTQARGAGSSESFNVPTEFAVE